jgi:hypothetical protein
MGVAAR